MKIVEITEAERASWGPRVQALEASATYPLGTDRFRIDHGADYFAFFERMGSLRYFAAVEESDVLAVGAAVLRDDVALRSGRPCRAWYLCDLKARPEHRGRGLSFQLLRHGFWRCYWRCPRAYGISMNPADGSPNPVVRLLRRFRWAPLESAATLCIHTMTPARFTALRPMLERGRGPASLVSLRGRKDLILASTRAPMPLFHVHFGAPPPASERAAIEEVPADATCMLCVPEADPLAAALAEGGAPLAASATIIAHRLRDADWRFINTSEI